MHPNLITVPGVDTPCLRTALAKAILNHPAVADTIKDDPELSQLYMLFLETDLHLHYQMSRATDSQPPG